MMSAILLSTTPLFFTIAEISSVMRTNSWRFFALNQRWSVKTFMESLPRDS
jgi:hypothetical protein